MNKYKRMYFVSPLYLSVMTILCCAPLALIGDVVLCLSGELRLGELVVGFTAVSLLLTGLCFAFAVVMNLIVNAFKSPSVYINDGCVICEGKKLNLELVKYVTLYLPEVRPRSRYTPQTLSVYVDFDEHLVINRPSVRLIAHVRKRCINAKFEIENPNHG